MIALAARVLWATVSHHLWGYHDDGLYDDGVYIEMARAFLGAGPIPMTHPPGYSLFLAPFLAFGDCGISIARWVQIGLSALIAPLVYRLALSLRQTRFTALIAGVFIAVHPMMIFFSTRMMSETLFVALACAFFLSWVWSWQSGRILPAMAAGFLGGLATLTRGVILPFGGLLALVSLWRRHEQRRWALLVVACGLCWGATISPWVARNWAVYRRFVPISVQGSWNLYEAQTVDPDEIRFKRAQAMGDEARARGLTDVFMVDQYFAAKAKAWIEANPGRFLRLCAIKAVRFWRLAPSSPHGTFAQWGAGVFTFVFLGAALLGLRRMIVVPGFWFPLSWILHLNLLHAVFTSNLRYRMPAEPVIAVLAGAGLAAILGLTE